MRCTLITPNMSMLRIGDLPLIPAPLAKHMETSALAAGGRSRLVSCGAYLRPSGVGTTVLRCCQGRSRAPRPRGKAL